jgi:hypothetical protein
MFIEYLVRMCKKHVYEIYFCRKGNGLARRWENEKKDMFFSWFVLSLLGSEPFVFIVDYFL